MDNKNYIIEDVISFKATLNVKELEKDLNIDHRTLANFSRRYFDYLRDTLSTKICGDFTLENRAPSLSVFLESQKEAEVAKEIIKTGFELFPNFISDMAKGDFRNIQPTIEKTLEYDSLNESLSENKTKTIKVKI